jgi:hypothetical protein
MAEGAGVLSCYYERPSSEQRDGQDPDFALVMALVFVPGDAESGTRQFACPRRAVGRRFHLRGKRKEGKSPSRKIAPLYLGFR